MSAVAGLASMPDRMEETIATPSRATGLLERLPSTAVILKFLLTGSTVTAVQLGAVTSLVLAGVPIQLALGMAYVVSLSLHFTLNRQWVFASDKGYAFRFTGQGARYIIIAISSYALTATGVAVVPGLLGIPQLAAFFLVTAMVACFSFLALHLWIFRAAPGHADRPE